MADEKNKPHHESEESINQLSSDSLFDFDEIENSDLFKEDSLDGDIPELLMSDMDVLSDFNQESQAEDESSQLIDNSLMFSEEEEAAILSMNSKDNVLSDNLEIEKEDTDNKNENSDGQKQLNNSHEHFKKIKKLILIGVGGFVVLAVLVFGVLSTLTRDKTSVGTPPQMEVVKEDDQSNDLLHAIGTSDSNMYNIIDGEADSILKEKIYANSDPTTVSFFKAVDEQLRMKISEVSSLENMVSNLENSISDKDRELNEMKNELELRNVAIGDGTEKIQNLEQLLSNANQTNKTLSIELSQLRADAKNKENIFASKDKEIQRLSQIEKQLTTIINKLDSQKSNEEKQYKSSAKPSELALVSVDPKAGSGKYIVISNGKAQKNISLKNGDNLVGRGKVDRIDAWGCIYFVDGNFYEPQGGYCK